jgi:hypothetical protein
VPTVTASTMIADLELADKVGCHIGLVEILEAVFVRRVWSHPFAKNAKGWATRGPGPHRWLVLGLKEFIGA